MEFSLSLSRYKNWFEFDQNNQCALNSLTAACFWTWAFFRDGQDGLDRAQACEAAVANKAGIVGQRSWLPCGVGSLASRALAQEIPPAVGAWGCKQAESSRLTMGTCGCPSKELAGLSRAHASLMTNLLQLKFLPIDSECPA